MTSEIILVLSYFFQTLVLLFLTSVNRIQTFIFINQYLENMVIKYIKYFIFVNTKNKYINLEIFFCKYHNNNKLLIKN